MLKVVAEHVLHKSVAGGVGLDLRNRDEVRATFPRFHACFGEDMRGVVVQPMLPRSLELLAGISSDEVFGPLVVFGLGGVATDLVADRAARLAPLSDTDADRLMRGLRSSEGIFTGQPRRTKTVRELLLRIGVLAELVPEIVELDLNPFVEQGDSVVALDWRIKLGRHHRTDGQLRYLNH